MVAQAMMAAGSAGANLAGTWYTNREQKKLAREQMQFQERMSSTAHQRQVADMRKAGLNPMLSAMGGSGAVSGGGAQAQLQNYEGGAVSSAIQASQLKKDLELADQKVAVDRASENLLKEQSKVAQHSAKKLFKEQQILDKEVKVMDAEANFRQEKAKVDASTYKYEKALDMVGKGLGSVVGGVTGGMISGSLKGLRKSNKKPKPSLDFRDNPKAKKRFIAPKRKKRNLY